MTDVFTPPEADLHDPIAAGDYGSIEKAIEGRYSFGIRELLSEAWNNIKGYKRTILLALLAYFAVVIIAQVITGFVFASNPVLLFISQQLLNLFIGTPILAGLYMLGIKRSVGAPATATDVFSYFNKTFKLAILVILMYVLVVIGFMLFVLPGIYLFVAYMMALPLAVEKDLSIWQSLEVSRKAVTKRWFKFFVFVLLIGLIVMLIAPLTLGIGLIWAIPLVSLAYAMLYRNMFGVEPETLGQ